MKCPKCGFTSFDYLESCKKCGNELTAFKTKHGLRSLLFPGLQRAAAEALQPEESPTAEEALLTEAGDATDFGFGFMDEEPAAPAPAAAPAEEEETFLSEDEIQGADDGISPPEDFDLEGAGDFDLSAEGEDLFAFDDEADELPPLDDAGVFDFDADEASDLPSWDELGEEEPATKKPADQKEPPDPFEQREPAVAGRAPEKPFGHFPAIATLPEAAADFASSPAEPSDGAAEEAAADDTTGPASPRPSATLVGRVGAMFADLLLLAAVLSGFLLLGQRLLQPPSTGVLPDPQLVLRLSTPYFLLLFLGCFGYFTLFHLFLGQTPGKMLFGLGVETLNGTPLAPAQAVLRSTGGLAALCLGGLGYAAILFDAEGRGWNDKLAGTRVVSWTGGRPNRGAA